MGITYVDEYETRKAVSDKTIGDDNYRLDYIAKSPIDGKVNEVNVTIYKVDGDKHVRLGYGNYIDASTSIRFDSNVTSVENQEDLAIQFYEDLKTLMA